MLIWSGCSGQVAEFIPGGEKGNLLRVNFSPRHPRSQPLEPERVPRFPCTNTFTLNRTGQSVGRGVIMAKASGQVIEFSIPFPHSLDTRIHLRLATQAKAIMLSLTTASQDEIGAATSLGSFVYALPDVSGNNSSCCVWDEWPCGGGMLT